MKKPCGYYDIIGKLRISTISIGELQLDFTCISWIFCWWFQTFSIFHNIWDNPSHWLMWHMWQSDAKWPAEKQRFQSSNVCRALVPSPWAPGGGRRGEDAALPFSSPFCWSSQNAWFMMVYGVYNCLLFHDSSCFIQFWFLSKKISKKNMNYYPIIRYN